jgi:ribosomal protein L44E
MEHYTKNTVEVQAYCNKCRRQTSHRVNGGRKGSCLECVAKLEKDHAARANVGAAGRAVEAVLKGSATK